MAAERESALDGLIGLELEGGLLHDELHWLTVILEAAAALIDLFAIFVLLIGAGRFPERVRRTNRERIELGRYILAGLELFIVSDVIHTALSLRMSDLLFLLLLVVIRSITSFFLDRELEQLKTELGRD